MSRGMRENSCELLNPPQISLEFLITRDLNFVEPIKHAGLVRLSS